MFASPNPTTWSKLQLPGLVLAIAAIVIAPFLLTQAAALASRDAQRLVAHSLQVEARLSSLAADVRNLESSALGHAYGVQAQLLTERMDLSRPRIAPQLAELEELTRDNPVQQRLLGQFHSMLDLRLSEVERMMNAQRRPTTDEVATLLTRYPIHHLIEDINTEEHRLLQERQATAATAMRRADALGWFALAAQLVLLGTLAWFALRQGQQRLEAERDAVLASGRATVVLDTVREPIALVDADTRVLMYNAAFAELYGVDVEDARGQPLVEFGGGAWNDPQVLRRLTDVLTRGRELWDFEVTQRTADEVERVMLLSARRMVLPDSDDMAVLLTASDISAQKIHERQIRELNRQLEGKVEQVSDVNRELEAFSYSVSHDLRAPLRHIAGFADKLGRHIGDQADDKSSHYLEVISGSARRMSALIDDLLVYSRLGRSALRLQMVDVQSMVTDTRAMLDSNAHAENPDHGIVWDVGHLPVVIADENMLRQVWLNVLGNAVKYSANSEPARIRVSYEQTDDGGHLFHVTDNGAGFDMQYANKLFGVFQRLHAPSEFSGTGIGLASVRRVLSRHGGRIWAESEPGKGASFHFTLPATGEIATQPEKTQ
ncbi:PAS domain-containing protein [Luteimonas yindakuii]|uniref:histidine kinase n=1 Tax=Luteimonas yindakuii TaxID=2565782 RepID=A0A4Z1RDR5_9GAMM|nr:ATP-binding protein [Luteimonas yindakuii]QCO68528.1 PAS domain-containing protein [Luteimonas yindakuii]TKS54968.1 PAS domain-containing protein [Luteimonas yindakuii]